MVIERAVIQTGKDKDGDITALCHAGQFWSPRRKADAIRDIESGACKYYVPMRSGSRTPIRVVDGPNGKYLRSDWDQTERNNLDHLPDCTC
ncbi:MAG: DUF3892 domain-containing protein [Pseudomonadota bacterium]|jgi:hypothetical protein|nr:DUF3892 domain-containing protein [Pseudomonadota bacterium]